MSLHVSVVNVKIYLNLLIESSVDRYLGCFQFGTIVNKAVMNIHVQVIGDICVHLGLRS